MGCPMLQENTIHQLSITFPSILPANAKTMIDQDSPVPTAGRGPWQEEPMEKIWLDHGGGTQPTHHGGRTSDFLDCGAQGSTGRNLYIAASSQTNLSSSPHSKMRAQIWVGAKISRKRTNVQKGSKCGTWSGNLEEVFLTASFFWTWGRVRMGGVAQCQ